jgi:hypothetical protein
VCVCVCVCVSLSVCICVCVCVPGCMCMSAHMCFRARSHVHKECFPGGQKDCVPLKGWHEEYRAKSLWGSRKSSPSSAASKGVAQLEKALASCCSEGKTPPAQGMLLRIEGLKEMQCTCTIEPSASFSRRSSPIAFVSASTPSPAFSVSRFPPICVVNVLS